MAEKQSSGGNISLSTPGNSDPQPAQGPSQDPELSAVDKLLEENKELKASLGVMRNENKRPKEMIGSEVEKERIVTQVDQNKKNGDSNKQGPGGLPEEVWEKILNGLEDSKDILNSFKTFPELSGRVLNNSYRWLLNQVIPHIVLLLSKKDVLNCRLVCKRWNFGVNNFLENHPSRRAYNREMEITGQHWIPEASLLHADVNRHFETEWKYIPFQYLREHFDIYEHPKDRNPFVGRAVSINDGLCLGIDSFWNEVLSLIQKYGCHIWFLDISFRLVKDCLCFCNLLKKILKYLPNLKKLKINANLWVTTTLATHLKKKGNQLTLPVLEKLESIEIYSYPSPTLLDVLVTSYSQQLKWLKTDGRSWKSEYCSLFPKLTELDLYDNLSLSEATNMLTELAAPELSRLCFGLSECHSSALGNNIIHLLARFPHLHSLTIRVAWLQRGRNICQLDHFSEPIKSLRSFCLLGLKDAQMSFDFLQFLPKLEYIHIAYTCCKLPHHFNEENIFEPGIWELLPKLKEVVLRGMMAGVGTSRFCRSQYEAQVRDKLVDLS